MNSTSNIILDFIRACQSYLKTARIEGMKKIVCFILILCIWGCSRLPEKLESPRLVISYGIKNNREVFTVNLLAGLKNNESDRVLFDVEGNVLFREGGGSIEKTPLTVIPFHVVKIFPFETAIISLRATGTGENCRPLFDLFEISRDEIVRNGRSRDISIRNENVKLQIISYRYESIYSVLKDKVRLDEKNK